MLRAAGLFLVAAGLVAISFALDVPSGPVTLGGNVALNESATDAGELSAHNSPTIVRNPTDAANLAMANRVDAAPFDCELRSSFDGGITWEVTEVPIPAGSPDECYAADASFGADGVLYFSFVILDGPGNIPRAAWVASSDDGGQTLATPVRVAGPLTFQLRVAADPEVPGRVYATWLRAKEVALFELSRTANPIVVSRSDDGGETWSDPLELSDPSRQRVLAASPVAGPGDSLSVLYLDLGEDRLDYSGEHLGRGGPPYDGEWSLVLARSGDAGETWEQSVVDEAVMPTERFIVFIPPFPSLAVDPDGKHLYASFTDGRSGDADVWLWRSDDGGESWAEPTRVNDNPAEDGTSQYRPQLALADDGRLDIAYYDRRADPENLETEVSLQSSDDGGESFGSALNLSDRPFDSRVGFGSNRKLADPGSRIGLAAGPDYDVVAWGDSRSGEIMFPKQDLALSGVAFDEGDISRTARDLIRGAGAMFGIAGIAAGLIALRRRQAGARQS